MRITMTRDALLERLTDRLKAALAEDARIAKKHVADEAAALIKFRKALSDALKWDYQTAKKKYFSVSLRIELQPSCPKPNANLIANVIRDFKLDGRKGPFVIQQGTPEYLAISWLPASERPKHSICD